MTNIGVGTRLQVIGPNDWEIMGRVTDVSYESGYITFTVVDVDGMEHTIGTGGHLGDTFINDYNQQCYVTVRS